MITTCQDYANHKDAVVIFESRECPLCAAIADVEAADEDEVTTEEEHEKELDKLRDKITTLEEELMEERDAHSTTKHNLSELERERNAN
jgi:hypothetical protein